MLYKTNDTLKDLTSVEFVFENGEGVIVKNEDFIMFDISNDMIRFCIDKKNNKKYYDDYTGWNVLFDRLLTNDITHIILRNKTFSKRDILIDWEDIYSNTNKNQNTYINEVGDLACEIVAG